MNTADLLKSKAAYMSALIEAYDPVARPVHCSNCRHAIVSGEWPDVKVECEQNYGKMKALAAVIRSGGQGFKPAAACPDFTSMSDAG